MKKYLITGIILVIISLGLVIYNEFIDIPDHLYLLTNTGSKKENEKVYINATFVAGKLASDDYYVMFGNGVQYLVHMDSKEASKIYNYLLDNPDDSYRIEGVTKLITDDMVSDGQKFVKEWLDNNHNHEEEEIDHTHDITEDDFYHYFGYVYMECNSFSVIKLFVYITGVLGTLFILYSVNTKYHLM